MTEETAKRGRPSKGPKVNLGAAISPEAMEALDRLAEAKGKPKAAVIEALILDAANGPAPLPKEAMDFAHEAAKFLAAHGNSQEAVLALEQAAWSAMGMARLSMGGKG